jgi:hypothetical protein
MLTSGTAPWIAHLVFWGLLGTGVALGEIRRMTAVMLLVLWGAGLWGAPLLPYGAALFPSVVALIDVALVLLVFKGDVRV